MHLKTNNNTKSNIRNYCSFRPLNKISKWKKRSLVLCVILSILVITHLKLPINFNEQSEDKLIPIGEDLYLSKDNGHIFKFVYGTGSDHVALDPTDSWDSASNDVINQVVETLWTNNLSNPNLKRINLLAESCKWKSDTQLRVTLKQGVFFHDGSPFNATAAKWSLDRLLYLMNHTGQLPPYPEGRRAIIHTLYEFPNGTAIFDRFEVVNNSALDIFLTAPYASILDAMTYVACGMVSPKSTPEHDFIDPHSGDLVGTGPFVYDGCTPDKQVRFHAFNNYWQGKAKIDILVYNIIQDSITRNNAMLNGDIDYLSGINTGLLDIFRQSSTVTLYEDPNSIGLTSFFLAMNNDVITNDGDPANGVNITWRKAITWAINNSYIIEELYYGMGNRSYSMISPGFGDFFDPNLPSYEGTAINEGNTTHARKIIKEEIGPYNTEVATRDINNDADWQVDYESDPQKIVSFNYSYNTDNWFRSELYVLLNEWLGKIGIWVIDGGTDWAYFLYRAFGYIPGGYDDLQLFYVGWGPDYFDPINMITPIVSNSSPSNSAQVNDPWIEGNISLYNSDIDLSYNERKWVIWNLTYLCTNILYTHIFVYHPKNFLAHSSKLYNVRYNNLNQFYAYPISLDLTINTAKIHITGNNWSNAIGAGYCTGSGTSLDPYIIKDQVIDATGYGSGILIENSNVQFRIENCTVINSEGQRSYYAGISVFNTSNGEIIENNCSFNKWSGISLCNSNNSVLSGNIAKNNGYSGLDIDDSYNNDISNNVLNYNNKSGLFSRGFCTTNNLTYNIASHNNNSGIYLFSHFYKNLISNNIVKFNNNSGIYFYYDNSENAISRNKIKFNNNSGIYFYYDNFENIIKRNLISNNTQYGIELNSHNNNFLENIIVNNSQIGFYINSGSGNNVISNIFLQNKKHARDDGWNNNWNNTLIGNFWDNYTDLDESPFDGIGDIPYNISGWANSKDYYPIFEYPALNESFIFINGSGYNTPDLSEIANVKWWITGSGSYSDPYVIEDLVFDGENLGSSIWIENTDKYLEIRNCTVFNSGTGSYDAGIKLVSSSKISLIDNDVSYNNRYGIYAWLCEDITISENIVNNNGDSGIYLRNSNNSNILDNTINNNTINGIKINPSESNVITGNNISYNLNYGIYLDLGTTLNRIYLNNFIQNTRHGFDNGISNMWNYGTMGNYWDNYTGKDVNDDGIGDNSYTYIYGSVGSEDPYPFYWDPPIISLNSPSMFELFGHTSPQFSISMDEGVNHTIWYTLDNGIINITSLTLDGSIEQTLWDSFPNGTITITFYVNDSRGFIDFTSVTLRKDIIIPIIIINSPFQNKVYIEPPIYNVRILDDNEIDRMWYSIDDEPSTITFISNGSISQSLWDLATDGNVTIIFYASDIVGNVANASINVIKTSTRQSLEPIIIDDTGAGDYTWEEAILQDWCSGFGTSSNPYLIESILISGQNTYSCLEIRNSNVHFIIRNSIFTYSGSGLYDAGIKLVNVENGILDNNNCSLNNNFGIILIDCLYITIQTSDVNDNDIGGIYLLKSDNNSIINNAETIKNNGIYGIKLNSSLNNIISGNVISNNYYGIFIFRSNNTVVHENSLIRNYQAIEEQESEQNDIGDDNEIDDIGGGSKIPYEMITIIVIIAAVVVFGITGAMLVKKKISSRGVSKKDKITRKKSDKIKEKLQQKLKFVDHLIKENKISLAYKNLGKVKDKADEYDFFDIFNQANEKIEVCKDIEAGIYRKDIIEKPTIPVEEKEILETTGVVPLIKEDFKVEKKEKYRIFMSYSTLDSDYFDVPRIVRSLEEFPDIDRVLYWEADSKQNIVEFMDETLKKCNVFILFVSRRSMKSAAVKDEWQAAFQRRKRDLLKFIPVYENEDDIPPILGHLLNVKFDKDDFRSFIERLHLEIQR